MDSNSNELARIDRESLPAEAALSEERPRPEGAVPQDDAASALRCHSDTGGLSSQLKSLKGYPDYLVAGGIDWWEWSAYVNWANKSLADTAFAAFELAKNSCQAERKSDVQIYLRDFGPIRVSRFGLNRGGKRGQHFEYRLYVDGMTIGISPRSILPDQINRKQTSPNFCMIQTGRDCLLVGAKDGYEKGSALIDALFGEVSDRKLSRVDLCLDVCNLSVTEMVSLVRSQQFVSRASHVKVHDNLVSGMITGITAGKAPLLLNVYDKAMERLGKVDQLYLQALIDRRWHGSTPYPAARIEYQLRRPWLMENGVSSPEDFFRLSGSLCEKLTHDWFRLTTEPVDRKNKHQSRATTHPLWIGVQDAFADLFGQPQGELVPIDRDKVTPIQLARQGRGCLVNCLLQKGIEFKTYIDFVRKVADLLLSIFPSQSERDVFLKEVERRKMEFETS
jgi:hypothetical protein